MSEVKERIRASAAAFHEKLWPLISHQLGGGRIVHVESVSDREFFKQVLDMYSGIDTWHVDDKGQRIRGLATRMQRTKRLFQTVTIRYHKQSGADTEIHKRLKSLNEPHNWIGPSVVIQGYFHPTDGGGYGEPRAVVIARMADVISLICEGEQGSNFRNPGDWYLDGTSNKYGHRDATAFAVVPVESLDRHGLKHKWMEF